VLLRTSLPSLLIASALAAGAAIGIGRPGPGGTALGIALVVTAAGSVLARRALGGTTGDTFGSVAKVVEVASYGVFAAFWV
jgi:cobalamin synthase